MMKFIESIRDLLKNVPEEMPWDLQEQIENKEDLLLIDVREADEFSHSHIEGSINIPRGILESACEWDFDETEPELVKAKDSTRKVVVVCRSGHRSLLSAWSLQMLGYHNVVSLKTGLRGWNDFDQEMIDNSGDVVDPDDIDEFFRTKLREDQKSPEK